MGEITTKKCPFCGEEILIEAIKCRYCGELLDSSRKDTMPSQSYRDHEGPAKLSCASCGAHLEVTGNEELLKCAYCSTVVLIRRKADKAPEKSKGYISTPQLYSEKISPLMRKGANYWVSGNTNHGGHVVLTEEDIIFIPHNFNFVQPYRLVLPISDVVKIWMSGVIAKNVNIQLRSGEVKRFVMWFRGRFVREVRARIK